MDSRSLKLIEKALVPVASVVPSGTGVKKTGQIQYSHANQNVLVDCSALSAFLQQIKVEAGAFLAEIHRMVLSFKTQGPREVFNRVGTRLKQEGFAENYALMFCGVLLALPCLG